MTRPGPGHRLRLFSTGAAATSAMMIASRALGSPVMADLHALAATVVRPRGSIAGDAVGHAAQLINGGLFAQAYEVALTRGPLSPGWRAGAALGLAHGVAAGLLLGAVPPLHPRVPDEVPAPGIFMRRRGAGAGVMLVALHGLYGAFVGAVIGAGDRARPQPRQAA